MYPGSSALPDLAARVPSSLRVNLVPRPRLSVVAGPPLPLCWKAEVHR